MSGAPAFAASGGRLASLNLVWTLMRLRFAPRSARERFRLAWIFLEPAGQAAVLLAIFAVVGRAPSYGPSFALFLVTGIVVLTLYVMGSGLVMAAVTGLASASRPAMAGPFHDAVSAILFKLLTAALYTAALLWGVGAWEGVATMPRHLPQAAAAFGWTALLAFGVGLLRGWAATFLPAAERVHGILSRGLIFVSGVFYAPSFLPPQLREPLSWNPLLHAVEAMRLGVYAEYPSLVHDPGYLRAVALGSAALGMAAVWRARARLMG